MKPNQTVFELNSRKISGYAPFLKGKFNNKTQLINRLMSTPAPSLEKRLIAETLGTFMLVFMGTFALTASYYRTNLNTGLAFGVAAIGAIYAFGHVSGAHLNPAVTLSLAVRGRFPWKEAAPYALAQIIGSVVAAFLNASIVGEGRIHATLLGATYPGLLGASAALITEIIITFILVLTILCVTEKESPSGFAGLAIGLVLGINVMLATDVSGGSMNPARSFGPALVLIFFGVSPTAAFDYHLIYWIGPLLGGLVAVWAHWIKS